LFFAGWTQSKNIDYLKINLSKAVTEKQQLQSLFSLCNEYRSLQADTLLHYAIEAKKIALQLGDKPAQIKAELYTGIVFARWGFTDSTFAIAERNLRWLNENGADNVLRLEYLFVKAQAYMRSNQYKEAMATYFESLKEAEKISDPILQAKAKSGLGWVHMELDQNKEAVVWFLKGLRSAGSRPAMLAGYSTLLANLASAYNNLGKYDSAFYFVQQAIQAATQKEELTPLANALNIEADIFIHTNKKQLAEADLNKAVVIRKQIGDAFYIVSDIGQLSSFYAQTGHFEKGIQLAKEGIGIAEKNKLAAKLPYLYEALGLNYRASGDYKNYSLVQEKIIGLKDSIYKDNSAHALAELETKYEVQKKENTIIQQKLDLVTKNYWLYAGMIVSAFGALLLYILFKNYRKRQQLKMDLILAEEKRISSFSIKDAAENERKRIAADLHDNLGAYAASIVSNLDTIYTEQAFNSTAVSALNELRSNSQSIVSELGDTIWALKKNALTITTVSDRVKLVIQKIQPSYPSIKIDVVEQIEIDHLLPPSQAFHLLQSIQEGIINALRHSNCTQLTITFKSTIQWEITIAEDGIGIATETLQSATGNGLHNMLNRSRQGSFFIEWLPNAPCGTSIRICPTTN
jgi:signal transduction histidine kinase